MEVWSTFRWWNTLHICLKREVKISQKWNWNIIVHEWMVCVSINIHSSKFQQITGGSRQRVHGYVGHNIPSGVFNLENSVKSYLHNILSDPVMHRVRLFNHVVELYRFWWKQLRRFFILCSSLICRLIDFSV